MPDASEQMITTTSNKLTRRRSCERTSSVVRRHAQLSYPSREGDFAGPVAARMGRATRMTRGSCMRCSILVLAAVAAALQSSTPYRIVQTFPLGGDGGWDYIVPDPPGHRIFIGRTNRVMVVDEQT